MIAGQKLRASDGYQVALFPMPYLYMSQDEGGDASHVNTYNIDLLGRDANGRIYQAPIYAPCDMKVVATRLNLSGGNLVVFESLDKVHLADGSLDYLTIYFGHDSNPPITLIGSIVLQGNLCYHTGTYGIGTGDHTHTCCGKGHFVGFTVRVGGHEDLTNRIHYWDAVYVNDTVIERGFNHPWVVFSDKGGGNFRRNNFPWVLYANKIRDRNNSKFI